MALTTGEIQTTHKTTKRPVTIIRPAQLADCVVIRTHDDRQLVVPWNLINIEVGE